jgi:UDP-N-acetylglucosamine:LPS N-acetylglucosamine transferase
MDLGPDFPGTNLVIWINMRHLIRLFVVGILFFQISFAYAGDKVRVLIFSAPFGSGHDAAAKRIKEILTEHYSRDGQEVEVVVKNTLDFSPPWLVNIALKQFSSVQTNAPIIYSVLFKNYTDGAHKVEHAGQMKLFKQLGVNAKQMNQFIKTGAFQDEAGRPVEPTAIFSTWPGSTEALIYLRRNKNPEFSEALNRIPLAHVQTDNAKDDVYFQLFAQDTVGRPGADVVYVPSLEIYNEYTEKLGFKNVVFTGMPLRLNGSQLPTVEDRESEKRAAREKLGIDPNAKTIMIEAGKNGATNYAAIIASIVKFNHQENLNIIAACGENDQYITMLKAFAEGAKPGTAEYKKLLKEMKELYNPKIIKNVLKKGFQAFKQEPIMTLNELSQLIQAGLPRNVQLIVRGFEPLAPLRTASDVILTKPGGLSTAEIAAANGRPMIILQEYASGEALPNGPLFAEKNLAVINNNISTVGTDVIDLLSDETKLAKMYEAAQAFRKQFKLERVIPFVDKAILESTSRPAIVETSPKIGILTRVASSCRLLLGIKSNP